MSYVTFMESSEYIMAPRYNVMNNPVVSANHGISSGEFFAKQQFLKDPLFPLRCLYKNISHQTAQKGSSTYSPNKGNRTKIGQLIHVGLI